MTLTPGYPNLHSKSRTRVMSARSAAGGSHLRSCPVSILPLESDSNDRVAGNGKYIYSRCNFIYTHDSSFVNRFLLMNWLREFGLQLRKARERAGLTQGQVAKHLSVTREQLSNYENGKQAPPINVAAELAKALGTEFVVRGCRIGLDLGSRPLSEAPGQQLCLNFDTEYTFPVASVTIRPMRDSIRITAAVSR
jgi:transcriptional regulator with XRE-family HTH domain